MMRLIPLLACCALFQALLFQAPSSQALAAEPQHHPVYKCTAGGKTSYADRPCAAGASSVLPPPAAGIAPEGAERVATQDSRTLLELEKLRLQRDKDAEHAERAQARAAAAASRSAAKSAARRHKGCERLRLRLKWADEDAARAHGKQREAARTKARRAAETMAVECPA